MLFDKYEYGSCERSRFGDFVLRNIRKDSHCHCNIGYQSVFNCWNGGSSFACGLMDGIEYGIGTSLMAWLFGGLNNFGGWLGQATCNLFGFNGMPGFQSWNDFLWPGVSTVKKEKPEVDPDDPVIKEYEDKINAEDVTEEQLQQYVEELTAYKEKLTENGQDDKNTEELAIDNLIKLAKGEVHAKDIDNPKISDLAARIALLNYGEVSEKDYQEINAAIMQAYNATDAIHTESDKNTYNSLLILLEEKKDGVNGASTTQITEILSDPEQLTQDNINILINNFSALSPEQKDKLKVQMQALVAELKNEDGSYQPGKTYEQLLALELLCKLDSSTVVNVENRNQSNDQWIKGKIFLVQKDDKGKLTYWVDCSDTGKNIKTSWKFEVLGDGSKVQIVGSDATASEKETNKVYNARINMEYVWDDTKKCYINRNGKPTAT